MENLNLDDIPGKVLQNSTKLLLAQYLNPEQDILSKNGFARDYRGLADQMDFDYNQIRNFQRSKSPTLEILNAWIFLPNTTIGQLVKYLENMGRHDVVQDFLSHFEKNELQQCIKEANNEEASCCLTGSSLNGSDILAEAKSNSVSSLTGSSLNGSDILTEGESNIASSCLTGPGLNDLNSLIGESTIKTSSSSLFGSYLNDCNILTERQSNTAAATSFMNSLKDSDSLIKQESITKKRDAFICYADEDCEFVYRLAGYLETKGLSSFIRDRDMIAGYHSEYEESLHLMEESCNFVLVILSPDFLKSPQYEAQAGFAAETGIMERQRKLVPIVYKECDIPKRFKYYSKIDFTKNSLESQLKKLIYSIRGDHSLSLLSPSED